MRFRLGRKSVRMHQGSFLTTLFYMIVVQSLILQTDGLNSLRLIRRKQVSSTTPPTTLPPSTPQPPSGLASLPIPPSNPTNPLPNSIQGRRRIRVRKLRVQKRQGALSTEEFDNANNNEEVREHLYQEHADEITTPDHYYSPIRRQRMRGNSKLFKQNPQHVQQQFHTSSLEESPSNVNFRKKERERERNRFPVSDHSDQENNEEYAQTTQPPPKNYAFAYAVRDDDNKEDNHFSHKEARDGKLTMGEYRINLPDGRVQVVRYTAGGNIGYKADVTYEGEGDDHPSKPALTAKPTAYTAGNNGYLPPSLSPASYRPPPTSPAPRKYRNRNKKKQSGIYNIPPTPTSAYSNLVEEPVNFGGFDKYESPTRERDDPTSYDKHYSPEVSYSNRQNNKPKASDSIYKRPRPSITYESFPIPSPPPSPSPKVYTSSNGEERERRRRRPSPSPNYDRPKPTSVYDNMQSAEKSDYTGNLAFLHDQSPRAGPSSRPKKNKQENDEHNNYHRGGAIGGYGYPGHPEIEEEINSLIKQSYRPQPNNNKKRHFKQRRKPRPENSAADLYNEPGPGNYYTAVNGPPPSAPPQFPKYPKPVYRSPSTQAQSYNYIDNTNEDHNNQEFADHHNSYQRDKSPSPSPPTAYGGYTPISFKSGQSQSLIPIENFKAGPAKKNYKTSNNKKPHQKPRKETFDHYYEDSASAIRAGPTKHHQQEPESVAYKEPYHYYNSQHPSYHHGGYIPPTPPASLNQHFPRIATSPSPSPPATSYTIDFPGGKHSFYLKTGPGSSGLSKAKSSPSSFKQQRFQHEAQSKYQSQSNQQSNRKKQSGNGSGLVFFETPGTGPRPSHRGVNDILSQLPNMPKSTSPSPASFPNTIIHPYEVGSKDYGHSVGYKNSFNTPSSGEKDEHDEPSHTKQGSEDGKANLETSTLSRDYLFDNGQEIVDLPEPQQRFTISPSPTPAQFHHEKSLSNTPLSIPRPVSTPQSFQDIDYQQNYQLVPVPPTPAISISTSHFHKPIRHDFTSSTDFDIDPRNAGGGGQSQNLISQPLGFTTIREEDATNINEAGGIHHSDLAYQYQYEDSVK